MAAAAPRQPWRRGGKRGPRAGAKGAGGGEGGPGEGGGAALAAAGGCRPAEAWRKAVCAADGVPAYRGLGNRGLEEVRCGAPVPHTRGALALALAA